MTKNEVKELTEELFVGATTAMHERMRQAEAERDRAYERIRELEGEAKEADREIEDYRADLNHAERQIQNLRKSEYDAHRRIRELEGDLSNARHDLQAVHALHERLRQAEAQRDEAWDILAEGSCLDRKLDFGKWPLARLAREIRSCAESAMAAESNALRVRVEERELTQKTLRELEGAVRSARLEIEDAIRERDELRRQVARLTNDRAEAWHALSFADKHFSAKNWEAVRKILCDSAAITHVAAFVAAHDARVRAEGWREGLRQAVALLREEACRREPHAEADALRVMVENLEIKVQREEGDPSDTPEYHTFVASMAKDCHCTDGPCDGVLAGGPCDEIVREECE